MYKWKDFDLHLNHIAWFSLNPSCHWRIYCFPMNYNIDFHYYYSWKYCWNWNWSKLFCSIVVELHHDMRNKYCVRFYTFITNILYELKWNLGVYNNESGLDFNVKMNGLFDSHLISNQNQSFQLTPSELQKHEMYLAWAYSSLTFCIEFTKYQ